jgi:hypothetical protein
MNETSLPREVDWLVGHPDGDVWVVGRTEIGLHARGLADPMDTAISP